MLNLFTSRRVLSLIHSSLFAVSAACSAHAADATLRITDEVSHPLPPAVFGQFLERPSWGNEYGPEAVADAQGKLSSEVETHLVGMHTTLVRFPHGTDGDYVDWQDMIDRPGRPARPVTTGHKGDTVTNNFGFPEYFALADRMKWSTILVTNLRDALYHKKPLAEAAAHSAELVAYATRSTVPVRIAAVQVGNEGWFFWPPKTPEERTALGLADDAACATWLRECLIAYADAIRAVRPDLPLIADAPRPLDGGGLENNAAAVWRAAVDHPDVRSRYAMLAAHAYAPMGMWSADRNGEKLKHANLSADEVWDAATTTLGRFDAQGRAVADALAYDDIAALGYRVAVTEWNWNGWDFAKRFPQTDFSDGMPAALGVAGFVHGLMRHEHVTLANQSLLLGVSWGITSVRVNPNGTVGYLPQAEAMRLHAEHHGSEVLASELTGSALIEAPVRLTTWWPQVARAAVLDAVVTADSAHYYVHLLNRHRTAAQTLKITLPDSAPQSGQANLHLLTAAPKANTASMGKMSRVELEQAWSDRVLNLEIPPAAIAVIVLPRAQN